LGGGPHARTHIPLARDDRGSDRGRVDDAASRVRRAFNTPGFRASEHVEPPPSSLPTAPTMQPPTPIPSPTPLAITSDDLTDALPTNPMLSKVQGYTFKESKNWVGGGDEGPEWVADAPLTKEQTRQVGVGAPRRVKPDACEARAMFGGYGWTKKWGSADYLKGVGYTK